MAPQKAAGEDLTIRRRRLRYRAWHRGTRELDLLLGPFADATTEQMGEAELDRFEKLLDVDESALQGWFFGQSLIPPAADRDLIGRIIAHRHPMT
jgi:antitoxin CptB